MFQYNRLNEILTYLKKNQEPISSKKLAGLFEISERTLRSDITNINMVIARHGATVILKRKIGYCIEISNEQSFSNFLDEEKIANGQSDELDTPDKRIKFILKVLLYETEFMSQDELAELIYVSKNTIANYMKTIRILLHEYHLTLETKANLGCRVLGKEENKRACIMEAVIPHNLQAYMIGFSSEEEKLFSGVELYKIEKLVLNYAKQNEFRFSDFNLKNLILHFALLITRLQMECPLENYTRITDKEIELLLYPLIQQIEQEFDLDIPLEEQHYIFSHFISNSTSDLNLQHNVAYINGLIDEILKNIYENYHFDLHVDELLVQDLKQHFQSILNAKQYDLNKRNPLLNTIKANYPLAFDITFTAITQVFEKEPYALTEDEIGYVSLHIGAAIERCFSAKIQKKSVIIVCGSGFATARMLEAKLNTIFKDKITICGRYSYNEYMRMDLENIDFVITTIPLETKDIPIVLVDFSLITKDIESITKTLTNTSINQSQVLDKFFDKHLFLNCTQVNSKEVLLHTMCNLLIENKVVPSSFEGSVLRREAIAATNMNDVLAIPHPMELCAFETKVVVAILDEPIKWNDQSSVRIVLLLAIKQNEHQDIEYLYESFIQIMNNPKLQGLIFKCSSYHEFLHVLHTHANII